ncbi:MAG: toll/interleukin-1 receptor domain-containing protein, partial [Zavarzinella sp.]|nr:toll/interleukin-1 receptor domain-containing protein [Zavarzinella sp.]
FTTHLLDGLRGKAAADDGLVKVFGLFEYAQLRVTAAFPKQHPVFKADLRRNFPVARNNAGEAGVVAREPAAAYRYDAYVAHADEDFDWVANRLIPALTKDGLRHTVSGDTLGQFRVVAVQEAVKKSKYVLLVISPHFTADRAARLAGILGLDQGLQQGIGKVIPVKIGEPTADVGLAVEALVGVDLTRPARRGEAEMARLLRQLHEDPQTW